MEIRQIKSGDKKYAEFVAAFGSIEQSFEWGELQCSIPGRPEFYVFGAFDGVELVGSILAIRQEMGFGKTWLWAPRAPVLRDAAAWPLLRDACAGMGDLYLRVEPGSPVDEKAAGESYMPEETLIVDLEVEESSILAQMAQKGRYNIKVADKAGVEIRCDCELGEFYKILKETSARDGFAVHSKEFYEKIPATFYGAFFGGKLIAGIFVTYFGETATYYFGASSNMHREVMAPYLLQWTAMRDAKAAGMKKYDFLGVAPEGETTHSLAGVTQFKTRFGGKRLKYPSARIVIFRPFWTFLVSCAKLFVRGR
ncbi:MAG: peptidoglycan bridge formation glycyltransferase FemA/FemB family protein [Patescibacteria group bacterium]